MVTIDVDKHYIPAADPVLAADLEAGPLASFRLDLVPEVRLVISSVGQGRAIPGGVLVEALLTLGLAPATADIVRLRDALKTLILPYLTEVSS